jgi:hypothetical protein
MMLAAEPGDRTSLPRGDRCRQRMPGYPGACTDQPYSACTRV